MPDFTTMQQQPDGMMHTMNALVQPPVQNVVDPGAAMRALRGDWRAQRPDRATFDTRDMYNQAHDQWRMNRFQHQQPGQAPGGPAGGPQAPGAPVAQPAPWQAQQLPGQQGGVGNSLGVQGLQQASSPFGMPTY